MTIEKVYDELISMISDLQKKGGGGGGTGNLSVEYVSEYVQPEPDTLYIILGSSFDVQAAYIRPAESQIVYTLVGHIPTATMIVLDDTYTDFLKEPVVLSDDTSTVDFTNKYIQLRSGSGTFYSWFKCIRLVDKAFYEKIQFTYTFQGQTYEDEVSLSSLLAAGDRFYVGFYYNTNSGGCRVGIAYWPELTPESLYMHQLKTGTGASGDIRISKFTLV